MQEYGESSPPMVLSRTDNLRISAYTNRSRFSRHSVRVREYGTKVYPA